MATQKADRNTIRHPRKKGVTITTEQDERGGLWRTEREAAHERTERRRFSAEELENALWLREHVSGLYAAVLGGGDPPGLALALSDVDTETIRSIYACARIDAAKEQRA